MTDPKPRDARTIEAILRSMGVESYDPRVVTQLLELEHRYITDVLREAHALTEFADKPAIDLDDVRLAIRSRCAFTFTQPPPREVTMRLAAERNAIPLPPVEQRAGIALPPAEFQLTRQNFRVVPRDGPRRPRGASSPTRPGYPNSPGRRPVPRGAPSPPRRPGVGAGPSAVRAKPPAPAGDVIMLDGEPDTGHGGGSAAPRSAGTAAPKTGLP